MLHHPVGQVTCTLLCNELKDAAMTFPAIAFIKQLEEHRVTDVQPGERLKGTWW